MAATILSRPDTEVMTPEEVARILQISTKTLSNWRYLHDGPPYFKQGGVVRYDRRKFAAYCASRTVTPRG